MIPRAFGPLSSGAIAAATEVTVASLVNPAAELALIGSAVPQWAVCKTVGAGTDDATWYRLDATSGATNVPYVVASLTAGLKWVAIAGRYVNEAMTINGALATLSGLTVSSNAAISGTGTITGVLAAQSSLTVATTATITGPLVAQSSLTVAGTARVNGATTGALGVTTTSITNPLGTAAWDNGYSLIAGPGTSSTASALAFSYNQTAEAGALICLTPLAAWRDMAYFTLSHAFFNGNSGFLAAKITSDSTLISYYGRGKALTSTPTAAATTTLAVTSTQVQIFTGTTTQTLQLPAANLLGAGVAVEYTIINRSTGTVTAQRAGADVFDGGGTTDAILTNTTRHYLSNGSNQWHRIQ